MWVRSQNKVMLSDYKSFYVDGNIVKGSIQGSTYTYDILGEYESEERALEVLDGIENYLVNLGNHIITLPLV